MRARLNWDAGNLEKCQKHGVSIEEIVGLFESDPFTGPDEAHSKDEDRFIAIGRNRSGRPLFVVFTLRDVEGEEHVRPLSARYMHRKEIEHYEIIWRKENSGSENG